MIFQERNSGTKTREQTMSKSTWSWNSKYEEWTIGKHIHQHLIDRNIYLNKYTSFNFLKCSAFCLIFEFFIQELLGNDGVLLCPTFPGSGVATYHRESYFKPFNFIYHAIFSAVGVPATVVPIGLSKSNEPGLPMSIQVWNAQ